VCDYYEQIGTYFKYGLLGQESFMDVACVTISSLYRNIQPCIEKMRSVRGESLYENFEYLAVQGLLWVRRHPQGSYPKRLPRFRNIDR
jgi:hypothetical protein